MVQILLIGSGAGAATALLFASVASGSPIAVVLFYLAPLPILIAALGWSHWAGLVAAVVAAAGLAFVLGPFLFIAFLIGTGLPAWWLGYLALLARPAADAPDGLEWYPVGHLIVWAALLSALVVIAGLISLGTDEESFRASLRSGFERMLRAQEIGAGADSRTAAAVPRLSRLLDLLAPALPAAAAVITTITSLVNLWLAARIVRISGLMRRPPVDLASMRFPTFAPALIAAAVAGTFVSGLIGIAAGALAASMVVAYAVLGFAALHTITRGMDSRAIVIGGVYAAVIILVWPVLVMTLLGLADTAFDIRGRITRRRGPPQLPNSNQ